MRNYVSVSFLTWSIHWDDGMGGSGDIQCFAAGGSPDELISNRDAETARQEAGPFSPGTTFIVTYPSDPVDCYWLLDKFNVTAFSNYFSNYFYGVVIDPGITGIPVPIVKKSDSNPRDGWKDENGVKREPPPSEKGGHASKIVAPESLLQSLLTFAGALVAAGYKTGGRPNLLTRLVVFIVAVKNSQPYDKQALSILLRQISSAVA